MHGVNHGMIGNAPPAQNRLPRLPAGNHLLAILRHVETQSRKAGPMISTDFVVLESDTVAPGSRYSVPYFVCGEYFETEVSKLRDFIVGLLGVTDPAQIQQASAWLVSEPQPGRGIRVKCAAIGGVSNNNKPFTNYDWSHVSQSDAEIAAMRAELDAGRPAQPAQAPAPAAQAFTPPTMPGSAPAAQAPAQPAQAPAPGAGFKSPFSS